MGMCAACLRLLAVILMLIGEWSGGLGLAAEAALHGDFCEELANHGRTLGVRVKTRKREATLALAG